MPPAHRELLVPMFATLLGPLPRPPLRPKATPTDLLREVLGVQEAAGLEPLTDAGFGVGATAVEQWMTAVALTSRVVKAVVLGPWSAASIPEERPAIARALNRELRSLAEAGCQYIEIHEPGATMIGSNETHRRRFREAHLRLLDGVTAPHLSLAITGGSGDAAGVDTLLAAPYASVAVDLIGGPDNWRLVSATPGDRGIVCGAVSVERNSDDRPEILLWAADYAASTSGRGLARVGLATAGSMAGLPWDVALRKLKVLGEAARLAELSPHERRSRMDPRAVDIRSAALGHVAPRPTRGRSRRGVDPRP